MQGWRGKRRVDRQQLVVERWIAHGRRWNGTQREHSLRAVGALRDAVTALRRVRAGAEVRQLRRMLQDLDDHDCDFGGRRSHVLFEGDIIYSYGHHFPMARLFNTFALVTTRTYSATTSGHMSLVRSMLRRAGIRMIEVLDPTGSDHNHNVRYALADVRERARKALAARQMFPWRVQELTEAEENLRSYCRRFHLKCPQMLDADFRQKLIPRLVAHRLTSGGRLAA